MIKASRVDKKAEIRIDRDEHAPIGFRSFEAVSCPSRRNHSASLPPAQRSIRNLTSPDGRRPGSRARGSRARRRGRRGYRPARRSG